MVTLADVANAAGTQVEDKFYFAKRIERDEIGCRNGQQMNQFKPNKKAWKVWRRLLNKLCVTRYQRRLLRPMGRWLVAPAQMRRSWPFWINPTHPEVLFAQAAQHEDGAFTAHPKLMFSYDAVASGAPDPAVFAGRVPVQARERKGTFFTTWSPLAMAPIVAPQPPTTFLELLPTLDQWERDLFDTCQFLVPYHEVLHIVCTEPIMFASDGGAASPKASFGWVLSTNQGQSLLHVSGHAYGAHSNSYRAEGYGILSVMRFIFQVQSFVTGTLSESRLCCDNKSMVASSHEVPAEWKRTPNSTQASDYDVLAEIWATRDLLPVTACPAVLHIKGHQDKKTAYDQLPLPAQLNVDADKLAGDYMTAHPDKDYTVVPVLPTSGVQLHLPAGTITYNMKKEVSMARTTGPMKQYMIKKHGWEEESLEARLGRGNLP